MQEQSLGLVVQQLEKSSSCLGECEQNSRNLSTPQLQKPASVACVAVPCGSNCCYDREVHQQVLAPLRLLICLSFALCCSLLCAYDWFRQHLAFQEHNVTMIVNGTETMRKLTGDMVMRFGMYKGRTFLDLKDNEVDYCRWVLCQQNPGSDLKPFADYLRSQGALRGPRTPSKGPRTPGKGPWTPGKGPWTPGKGPLTPSKGPLTPSKSSDVDDQAPTLMGDSPVSFGKYKGRTFADLRENETEYVAWVLRQESPTGDLKPFADYLKGGPETPSTPAKDTTHLSPAPVAESVLTVGKFKGRTFEDLKENEPEYVEWTLRQPVLTGDFQAFAEYLKAEGRSLDSPGLKRRSPEVKAEYMKAEGLFHSPSPKRRSPEEPPPLNFTSCRSEQKEEEKKEEAPGKFDWSIQWNSPSVPLPPPMSWWLAQNTRRRGTGPHPLVNRGVELSRVNDYSLSKLNQSLADQLKEEAKLFKEADGIRDFVKEYGTNDVLRNLWGEEDVDPLDPSFAQITPNVVSIPAAASTGLFVGSGVTFVMLHVRAKTARLHQRWH